MRRKPPFPYLGSPVRTGKALEMSWAKSVQDCLIFGIDVCCVCAHKCNTPLKLSTHIMRAHNMPCHDHQDTHQQETTHTPKVPFKCHRNTRKIPRKHNIPHACPNATKTHKPTLHNSMTNVTDHKGSAQTCRLYIGTAWAQRDAATTQHGLNIAQREPQVRLT